MNIGYLIAGCVFLFNPTVNLIDVLPDVAGYLLILKGLYRLSDLNGKIKTARQKFKAAVWISLGELLAMLMIPILDVTWYLILSFVFGVLKLIYLIPAFVNLFEGISYLELRYTHHKARRESAAKPRFGGVFDKTEFESGTAYFELYEKKNAPNSAPFFERGISFSGGDERLCIADAGFSSRNRDKTVYLYESDEARIMSVVFVIVHVVCACLPEFTAIAGTGGGYVTADPTDFTGLRTVLALFLAGISAVIGILWLVRMLRYFNGFRRDRRFVSVLEEKYTAEIVPDGLLWTGRKTRRILYALRGRFCFFPVSADQRRQSRRTSYRFVLFCAGIYVGRCDAVRLPRSGRICAAPPCCVGKDGAVYRFFRCGLCTACSLFRKICGKRFPLRGGGLRSGIYRVFDLLCIGFPHVFSCGSGKKARLPEAGAAVYGDVLSGAF